MAIQFFCGRPGSGKSYGVIENVVLPALKADRRIYTNIPLLLDAVHADFPASMDRVVQFVNEDVTGDFLMSLPGGAIIIIDECWRFWPSGLKVTDMDSQHKEFFAEHRHKAGDDKLTQEIVLVSQSPSQIAKYVRDLIDQTVLTTKADKVGLKNQYQVKIYSACIPSIDRPGEPNITGMGTYKPEIYKYYKSHTKSETGLPGIEIKADKRGSIWGHWYIKYLAPVVIVASVWGAVFLFNFFTGKKIHAPSPVQVSEARQPELHAPVSVSESLAPTQPVIVPSPLVDSPTKRITATVVINGVQMVYVSHVDKRHLIRVAMEHCKGTINGLSCVVDNEIVTAYTGKQQDEVDHAPTLTESVVPKV